MMNLGHQLCIGSVSKCFEIRIVEGRGEKRKLLFCFLGRSGQLAHFFILFIYFIFVLVCLLCCWNDNFEKAMSSLPKWPVHYSFVILRRLCLVVNQRCNIVAITLHI